MRKVTRPRAGVHVGLLCLIAACSPSAPPERPSDTAPAESAFNPEAVADTLRSLAAAFWDAWAAADVDAGLTFLAEDATAVTKTGAILRGRQTIDAAWRPGFADITGQTIAFDSVFASAFGPDLGSVHQMGTFLVRYADGTTEGPIPFTYTTVWMLRDGDWRIVVAHRTDRSR